MGKQWKQWQTLFLGAPKWLHMVTAAMKLKDACSLEEKHRQHIKEKPRQHIKKQRHYIANKGLSSQSYDVSSSHVWMWELHCQRIDAFELWCWRRLLRVPWTARSNKSILEEISPEYSLERLILKLKLQYFGHLMRRTDPFGKDPDAGKDWRQEEKGIIEDEMVWWHHLLNEHEFE